MHYKLFFVFITLHSLVNGMANNKLSPKVVESIQKELAQMAQEDQELRKEMLIRAKNGESMNLLKTEMLKPKSQEHIDNLKKIIAQYGWPKISEFGADTAEHTWLLVQHADHDLEFQESCLNFIVPSPVQNYVLNKHFAYLFDRVRINKERPQYYGTQVDETGKLLPIENCKYALDDIDIALINARRESVGLCSIEEYRTDIFKALLPTVSQ